MMYEGFASVYDRLMADVDYDGWAAYVLALAQKHGVSVAKAVDAACGTGNLTLALAARGVSMTGADLSPEMLAIASGKARTRGFSVPFVRQDMQNLRLHRPVDAVFCACDGVNYLTKPAEVSAFFAAAFAALRPGGGLFFDVSTEAKLQKTLGDNCLGSDDEAVSYLWQNHYDPTARLLQMDLTFFLREADGRYRRFSETHIQRAHALDELTGRLAAAGFSGVAAYGDRTFAKPRAAEARIHIAATRP